MIPDVCRKLGVSTATFYLWRKKYADLALHQLRELRHLREENSKLKQLVADLSLDPAHAAGADLYKVIAPQRRRELAWWLKDAYRLSERHAARLVLLCRATLRYTSSRDRREALRIRLRELAAARVRFGYRAAHSSAEARGMGSQCKMHLPPLQLSMTLSPSWAPESITVDNGLNASSFLRERRRLTPSSQHVRTASTAIESDTEWSSTNKGTLLTIMNTRSAAITRSLHSA